MEKKSFAPVQDPTVLASIRAGSGNDNYDQLVDRMVVGLTTPADFDKVVSDASTGETWLRDVSGYNEAERNRVLSVMGVVVENGGSVAAPDVELMRQATNNLGEFMIASRGHDQLAFSGWNFLVNARGFLGTLRSADLLDKSFRDVHGTGILELVHDLEGSHGDARMAHELVAAVARDERQAARIGYYLAERSLCSEQFQEKTYGDLLEPAKNLIARTVQDIASGSGLSTTHLERVLRQLRFTKFSAFDHLMFGVTAGDNSSTGDYYPGTLRVEVKYAGTTSNPQMPTVGQARKTVTHETTHSASVQDELGRCGLSIAGGEGVEANEAMTEFLSQMAQGFPDFEERNDGRTYVHSMYPREVTALYSVYLSDRPTFNTLFNAYFGQVTNSQRLKQSLSAFYTAYNALPAYA